MQPMNEQTYALQELLARGKEDIALGRYTPATTVFATIEELDRQASQPTGPTDNASPT